MIKLIKRYRSHTQARALKPADPVFTVQVEEVMADLVSPRT